MVVNEMALSVTSIAIVRVLNVDGLSIVTENVTSRKISSATQVG